MLENKNLNIAVRVKSKRRDNSDFPFRKSIHISMLENKNLSIAVRVKSKRRENSDFPF